MKNLVCVIGMSVFGMLLAGNSTQSQTQETKSVVHPAPASQTISVTVTDLGRAGQGHGVEIVIAQAAGFPTDTCDVVTTFDVVRKFEERQNWRNVRQKIEIVVDGKAYPAKFRDVGLYPLGLNLACIDFESPFLHASLKIPVLALDRDSPVAVSSLSYDDKEVTRINPGTPLLNERGEISAVLVATGNGQLEFASAHDIRLFLKVAADLIPRPTGND